MSRILPPLRAARAFEAAARLGSFVQAGRELHQSATAVSQQVKVLENWLGVDLFQRQHNFLVLTPQGEQLLPGLKVAFDTLAEATGEVRADAGQRQVRIAAFPNVALNWLVPRLDAMRQAFPDVAIDVRTITAPLPELFRRVDLAVRVYEHAPQYQFDFLFAAELFPVASPRLEGLPRRLPMSPAELLTLPLLHLSHFPEDWRIWSQAAGLQGATPRVALQFDSQAVMMAAAERGLGVALARSPFDDEAVRAGRLRVLHPVRVPCPEGWYVITPATLRHGKVSAVRDWLLAHAGPGLGVTAAA